MFGKGSELKKGKDSKPTSLRNTSENTKKKVKNIEKEVAQKLEQTIDKEKLASIRKNVKKKRVVFGIKMKLYGGFALPILCVILVGVVSYQKAAQGMSENYESATMRSMNMAVQMCIRDRF